MGHVINPISFRLGYTRYWNSVWSLSTLKNYSHLTNQDYLIQSVILNYFKKLFTHNRARFTLLISGLRIFRQYKKTQIVLFLYDSIQETELSRYLSINLQKLMLRWRLFRAYNWRSYRWMPRLSTLSSILNTKEVSSQSKRFITFKTQYLKYLFNSKAFVDHNLFFTLFKQYYIYKVRQNQKKFWTLLKFILSLLLSPIISINPSLITLVGLNSFSINANFIAAFIAYHLEHKYFLFQILKSVWASLNKLISNRILYGYMVQLSGRFKKNEKAVYLTKHIGSVGRYDIKRGLDYATHSARMRLGVTGIKVWLAYAVASDMKIKTDLSKNYVSSYAQWAVNNSTIFLPIKQLKKSTYYHFISTKANSDITLFNRVPFIYSIGYSRSLLAKYSYIY